MGFFELHMICGMEEVGVEHKARDAHRALGTQTTSACLPACLPDLLQVPEEQVVVFIQKPWKG